MGAPPKGEQAPPARGSGEKSEKEKMLAGEVSATYSTVAGSFSPSMLCVEACPSRVGSVEATPLGHTTRHKDAVLEQVLPG